MVTAPFYVRLARWSILICLVTAKSRRLSSMITDFRANSGMDFALSSVMMPFSSFFQSSSSWMVWSVFVFFQLVEYNACNANRFCAKRQTF